MTISRACAEQMIRLAFDGRERMPAHEFACWFAEMVITQTNVARMRHEFDKQVISKEQP